jgi:hypothetical protein
MAMESLVNDIPAGDGKMANIIFQCIEKEVRRESESIFLQIFAGGLRWTL